MPRFSFGCLRTTAELCCTAPNTQTALQAPPCLLSDLGSYRQKFNMVNSQWQGKTASWPSPLQPFSRWSNRRQWIAARQSEKALRRRTGHDRTREENHFWKIKKSRLTYSLWTEVSAGGPQSQSQIEDSSQLFFTSHPSVSPSFLSLSALTHQLLLPLFAFKTLDTHIKIPPLQDKSSQCLESYKTNALTILSCFGILLHNFHISFIISFFPFFSQHFHLLLSLSPFNLSVFCLLMSLSSILSFSCLGYTFLILYFSKAFSCFTHSSLSVPFSCLFSCPSLSPPPPVCDSNLPVEQLCSPVRPQTKWKLWHF